MDGLQTAEFVSFLLYGVSVLQCFVASNCCSEIFLKGILLLLLLYEDQNELEYVYIMKGGLKRVRVTID